MLCNHLKCSLFDKVFTVIAISIASVSKGKAGLARIWLGFASQTLAYDPALKKNCQII